MVSSRLVSHVLYIFGRFNHRSVSDSFQKKPEVKPVRKTVCRGWMGTKDQEVLLRVRRERSASYQHERVLTPLRWKTWSSIQHGEWALRKVCESSPGGEESKTVRDTLYTGGRSRKEGTPRSCMSCMMLNTRWKSVLGLKQMLGGEKPSEGKSERPLRATACTHYANIYPPTWVPAPSYP